MFSRSVIHNGQKWKQLNLKQLKIKCGTFMQWKINQPLEEMEHGWMLQHG